MLRTILGGVMLLALVAQAQAQTAVAHVTIDTSKPGPEIDRPGFPSEDPPSAPVPPPGVVIAAEQPLAGLAGDRDLRVGQGEGPAQFIFQFAGDHQMRPFRQAGGRRIRVLARRG